MSQNASKFLRPAYLAASEDLRDNPAQWQVYESKGNCVVLAGPGSGKTKTLTVKLTRMVEEDVKPPRGVACITYSNECAEELKRRLKSLGVAGRDHVFIGTVHSFCLQHVLEPFGRLAGLVLPYPLTVANNLEQATCFATALTAVFGANEPPWRWETEFNKFRRLVLDRDSAAWRSNEQLARLVERYEANLRGRGLIDFDDMMLSGFNLIKDNEWIRRAIQAKFPILVIDEYQDLGSPLHGIVWYLCFWAGVRILAVGDPDQSIYGFVGAKPELLRRLAGTNGTESVHLRFNYRCGKRIVRASEVALGEAREYESRGGHDGLIDWHECPGGLEEQASRVCTEIIPAALARRDGRRIGDIAILYRAKSEGDVVARQATESGFNIIRIDKNAPYPKTRLTRWLESCAAWCAGGWEIGSPSLSGLVRTWLGFNRIIGAGSDANGARLELARALITSRSKTALAREWLTVFDAMLRPLLERDPTFKHESEGLDRLIKALAPGAVMGTLSLPQFAAQRGSADHLNLITLHSSKGLEFEVVILMGLDQGNIPNAQHHGKSSPEDRRLFYVGMTRAKHEFHMTYSGWTTRGRYVKTWGPSEFLLEVKAKVGET